MISIFVAILLIDAFKIESWLYTNQLADDHPLSELSATTSSRINVRLKFR